MFFFFFVSRSPSCFFFNQTRRVTAQRFSTLLLHRRCIAIVSTISKKKKKKEICVRQERELKNKRVLLGLYTCWVCIGEDEAQASQRWASKHVEIKRTLYWCTVKSNNCHYETSRLRAENKRGASISVGAGRVCHLRACALHSRKSAHVRSTHSAGHLNFFLCLINFYVLMLRGSLAFCQRFVSAAKHILPN